METFAETKLGVIGKFIGREMPYGRIIVLNKKNLPYDKLKRFAAFHKSKTGFMIILNLKFLVVHFYTFMRTYPCFITSKPGGYKTSWTLLLFQSGEEVVNKIKNALIMGLFLKTIFIMLYYYSH